MRTGEYAPGGAVVRDSARSTIRAPSEQRCQTAGGGADFRDEVAVLLKLGIGKPTIARAVELARHNGTAIEDELLANGWINADSYYAALARMLQLPFLDELDIRLIHDNEALDTQLNQPTMVRLHYMHQGMHAMVPRARQIAALNARFEAKPELRRQFVVTTSKALRAAVWNAGARRRINDSVNGLFERSPELSARIVLLGKQGFFAGVAITALVIGAIFNDAVVLALHASVSIFYLAAMMIRIAALTNRRHRFDHPAAPEGPVPVYTILIALYKEAAVASQLVASLKRLRWPASRLDIKLVCEADDHETIAALRAQELGPQFEIVEVPPARPRTKPKALNYALAAARGELLAVYDAEDRPHPDQLREAHATFAASSEEIVCLQAPLAIANSGDSWISTSFALEYSALFRMLLPMLARFRLPMPLGGTSNHFKTEALKEAGGWDPYNVTEDADLGMRLYRRGYRCGVLSCRTLEDAPSTPKMWIHQRTRWFKGWLQTWLVLMREPQKPMREMGLFGFAVFQLLIAGMLLSSLAHPWLLVFLASAAIDVIIGTTAKQPVEWILFGIDFCNVVFSYIIFVGLGRMKLDGSEQAAMGLRWTGLPLYWLMLSAAAWRAVLQLRTNPFFWDKTPHTPSKRRA
ncbi:glycosyltransferase [Rhizobium sp. P32RR-XVIII]|uniref:glycosyltransferase family 2 protein n=1 Tax=Rhizobium sp. P32RR-XVIII TaxID=2726738 RepID=UPI001456FC53|nr:glycosyltransferase family 2 protein [Rhizobium sp. P32RR-XVIII]NLS02209.1 glycosyltransferase [Rhizobium sp. P32RR-XVIII]